MYRQRKGVIKLWSREKGSEVVVYVYRRRMMMFARMIYGEG